MSGTDLINALLPLVIIFGLLYGVLFFVRKFSFSTKNKISKKLQVRVISNQMIMPKKYVSVIKIKDKLLVLGVSESSINLLKEFDDDLGLDDEDKVEITSANFLDVLRQNLKMK